MEYMALYRKWRPQKFSDIICQEDIRRTLLNSINNNRLVHAYIFCGSRGTGKTSTARIFAKAVNCLNSQNGEPCDECESCRSIMEGNSMDVLEIDAASNRGIDEARNLLEKVRFLPVISKYKVYIIDEAHMLTMESFNALLKTFEEPPGHVIFILATTESRKVPLTILSRCQRFDFKRIDERSIEKAVGCVAKKEGFSVNDEALGMIARKSGGSMRDALGLLDQALSYSKDIVDQNVISAILGTVDQSFWDHFLTALAKKDLKELYGDIDSLIRSGKDLRLFVQDMMKVLSDLLIISLGGSKDDLSQSFLDVLNSHKKDFTSKQILSFLNIGSDADPLLRYNPDPRMVVELTIAKMVMVDDISMVEAVVADNKPKAVVSDATKVACKPKTVEPPKDKEVNLKTVWADILKAVKVDAPRSMSWLQVGVLAGINGNVLNIKYGPNFSMHSERLMSEPHKSNIEGCATKVLGRPVEIKVIN